jgi:xanthine dehydrogenase accessory factor
VIILIRGGGDLASGVALRLSRTGLWVVITELPIPLAVRRRVSFAEAIYAGSVEIEGVTGRRIENPTEINEIKQTLTRGEIPVIVDPQLKTVKLLKPGVIVDARMIKRHAKLPPDASSLVIGLGPGFIAGGNCNAVIETNRGHRLGRVLWEGSAQADTGIPDSVQNHRSDRVLRAPVSGRLSVFAEIGDLLDEGQPVAEVGEVMLLAPFKGVLRGILHPGLQVEAGLKIGDIDPRADPQFCFMVSDKSLAIGGGVLEAILSRPELRARLWEKS